MAANRRMVSSGTSIQGLRSRLSSERVGADGNAEMSIREIIAVQAKVLITALILVGGALNDLATLSFSPQGTQLKKPKWMSTSTNQWPDIFDFRAF